MFNVSEYSNKQINKLTTNQQKALNNFLYFLNVKKDIKDPEIKIIPKKDFIRFKLYRRHTIYKQLGKSLVAYVN